MIGQDAGQHPFDLLAFNYLAELESKVVNCSADVSLEGSMIVVPEAKGNSNSGIWQFNPDQGIRFDVQYPNGMHKLSIFRHGTSIAELWLPSDQNSGGNGKIAQQGNMFIDRYWPMWLDFYLNSGVVKYPQEISTQPSENTLEIKLPGNPSIFVTFLEMQYGLQITKLNSSVRNSNGFSADFERTFENEIVDGRWIPKSCVERRSGAYGNGELRLRFSGNSVDSDGRLIWDVEFPPGTKINDHISKQYYEVGKTSDPVSSVESMANFARRSDLSKPSVFGMFSKTTTWRFPVVALILATTFVAVLILAMYKRTKS